MEEKLSESDLKLQINGCKVPKIDTTLFS